MTEISWFFALLVLGPGGRVGAPWFDPPGSLVW